MKAAFLALALLALPLHAAGIPRAMVVPVQATAPQSSLLVQAEALDATAVRTAIDDAFAAIGCTLPGDLVTVFEIFLLDRVMSSLGEPVGPEVARQGVFALRLRSTTIDHLEARAVLAVARALEGQVAEIVQSDRVTLRRGLFLIDDCVPGGTIFALSPYARQ